MKFWDYTKDEREQWRQDVMTKAYLAELAEQRENYTGAALADLLSTMASDAFVSAGRVSGIERAIDVAENEQ